MTIPNFSDFGLTSAFWAPDATKITADAQLRVSNFTDSLALINPYTQATDANKPLYSRADNKENGFPESHSLSGASGYWAISNVTKSGSYIVAGNNSSTKATFILTGFSGNQYHTVIGNSYKIQGRLKYDNWQYAYVRMNNAQIGLTLNLITGTITTTHNATGVLSGATASLNANGETEFEVTFTPTATAQFRYYAYFATNGSYRETNTAPVTVGTERIRIDYISIKHSSADSEVIETTDHPQYAGVNGQRWLVFNGAQRLNSTSLASSIMTTTNKLLYAVVSPFLVSASFATDQRIWQFSDGVFVAFQPASTTNVRVSNFDGTTDVDNIAMPTTPVIIRARQSGGSVYIATDTGAGFTESAGVASGASSAMTASLILGTNSISTNGFYGKIGGILTANTGAPKPNLEKLLRDSVFPSSLLSLDLFTGNLRLGRFT